MTAGGAVVGGDVSHKSVEDFLSPKTPSKLTRDPAKGTSRTPKTLLPIYKRPRPQDLIIALNDRIGAQYLTAAVDTRDYFRRAQFYHSCLLLIITGLNYNELVELYKTSLPGFFQALDDDQKEHLFSRFCETYNQIEVYLLCVLVQAGQIWLASLAGKKYKKLLGLATYDNALYFI